MDGSGWKTPPTSLIVPPTGDYPLTVVGAATGATYPLPAELVTYYAALPTPMTVRQATLYLQDADTYEYDAQVVNIATGEVSRAFGVADAGAVRELQRMLIGVQQIVIGEAGTGGVTLRIASDGSFTIEQGVPIDIASDVLLSNSANMHITGNLTVDGTISPSGGGVQVDLLTTPGTGTWTKPTGATMVRVICVGGGGGGGAGRHGAGAGGGGGGGAMVVSMDIPASMLAATVPYKVGAGGGGGTASGVNDTSGGPGGTGTGSSFGENVGTTVTTTPRVFAGGGAGGNGGTNVQGTGGAGASFNSVALGGNGGTGNTGNGTAGGDAHFGMAAGGGGGGGTTPGNGGAGGLSLPFNGTRSAGGTGGTGNGNPGTAAIGVGPGNGGSGAAGNNAGNAGTGGAGGTYGAGGGGGGAAPNANVAGNGGAGSDGAILVISWT